MRASCETDLARRFTLAVGAKWLGNTQAVAMCHYVDVTDGDFERAIHEGDAHAARKEAQYLSETGAIGGKSKIPKTQKPRKFRGFRVDANHYGISRWRRREFVKKWRLRYKSRCNVISCMRLRSC